MMWWCSGSREGGEEGEAGGGEGGKGKCDGVRTDDGLGIRVDRVEGR